MFEGLFGRLKSKKNDKDHSTKHTSNEETDIMKDQIELEAKLEDAKLEDEEPTEEEKSATMACSGCKAEVSVLEMKKNLFVCPNCGKHLPISAERRVRGLCDPGTFRKLKCTVPFVDPLGYPDYEEKITKLQVKTGLDEGVLSGVGEIDGHKAVIAVMGSEFLMGSMGIAVGEKITNAFEVADKLKLPLVIFTASGGARMQEGILSLMQMAKTSAAAEKFSEHGGLYVAVLTHPTTGGVSASFATLGDITIAEPGALIGFAGPRVIEQTIGQKLPEGFQRAEYLESHGFVDQIVKRQDMREVISQILKLHEKKRR